MAKYAYKAKNKVGDLIEGELTVIDEQDLYNRLEEEKLFIIDYCRIKEKSQGTEFDILAPFRKISLKEISVFSWQLSSMINAGIPLLKSIDIAGDQIQNPRFRAVLKEVTKQVEGGMTFSQALTKHPKVFSKFYIGMIEVGESTGNLDSNLKELCKYVDARLDIRSKIISAFSYPLFMLTATVLAIIFLLIYVFPNITQVLKDSGAPIPFTTKLIMLTGDLLTKNQLPLIVGLGVIAFAIWMIFKGRDGKRRKDSILLKIPIFGNLITKLTVAQFSMSLASLVKSGVPLLKSLEIVEGLVSNVLLLDTLKQLKEKVKEGKPLSEPMFQSKIMPRMVAEMVKVGEESGQLEQMLTKVSEYYQTDVDYTIKSMIKLIEPLLIVAMTIIVGVLAASVFLPITEISTNMNK